MGTEGDLETDYPALRAGYVTITPVRHDLTHEPMLARLGGLDLDLPGRPC